jgi:hypothetical protein
MFLVGKLDVLENLLLNGGDSAGESGRPEAIQRILGSFCAEELTEIPKWALEELKIFIGRSDVGEFRFGGHTIQHGLHDKKSNHTTRILPEQNDLEHWLPLTTQSQKNSLDIGLIPAIYRISILLVREGISLLVCRARLCILSCSITIHGETSSIYLFTS